MKYTIWLESIHLIHKLFYDGIVFPFDLTESFSRWTIQAGALENIVKESQLEIVELRHSVEELRYIHLLYLTVVQAVHSYLEYLI